MLKRFANLFATSAPATTAREPEARHLATCVLLLEAARADNDFTDAERQHILEVLQQRFFLPEDEAAELLELGMDAHTDSTDLYRFTREINASFSLEDKIGVVEEIWRIFYSDGELDGHEDHLAAKLRNLLNLSHPVMIEAKMRVLREIRGVA